MTPDPAKVVGELTADGNSREVWRTMRTVGLATPSRSFLEKRGGSMAGELSANVEQLEASARAIRDMKSWYRHELLRDDDAIDRIWRNLRRKAKTLPRDATSERSAVAAALSYIRRRNNKMRYASLYACSTRERFHGFFCSA